MKNPFRYFKTPPEIIRLAVMLYVRYPLSLRQVEDILLERGIEISDPIRRLSSMSFDWDEQAEMLENLVSQLLGERAKAPGTAGYGGGFSLAVGSHQK